MPIFHFNLADEARVPDVEGTDLPGIEEARKEAIVFAGAYLRDNPQLIQGGKPFCVEVTDDTGAPLFTVEMKIADGRPTEC